MKQIIYLGTILCMLSLGAADLKAQDGNTITGHVTSITADDQSSTRGTTKDERRYPVRVTLDSVQNTVLGFGEFGKSMVAQQAMLDLLSRAMENRWEVTLRLRRDNSSSRSHAQIVSVTVRP